MQTFSHLIQIKGLKVPFNILVEQFSSFILNGTKLPLKLPQLLKYILLHFLAKLNSTLLDM